MYRSYPVYRDYGYYEPVYSSYGISPAPSRALSGALLGGIAGAIIGNNSGTFRHDAWRGAAVGAGAGLLIGAIADNAARDNAPGERPPVYVQQPRHESSASTVPTPSPGPQTVTIINNYYGDGRPMSSANRLYGR